MEEEEFIKRCKETQVPQDRIDAMIEASKELRTKHANLAPPVLSQLIQIFFKTAFQSIHYSVHSYPLMACQKRKIVKLKQENERS